MEMISVEAANEWKTSAMPIYRRIAEDLREQIVSGTIQEGEKLPSEAELSAKLGVNHQTLRKSLKILAEQRLISQCQGKGTFVSYHKQEHLRIGLVVGDLSLVSGDIYLLRMISALSQALNKEYRGELVLIDSWNPEIFLDRFNQYACDALIVLDVRILITHYLCRPEFAEIPMVFINSADDVLTQAGKYDVCTEFGATRIAVEQLYQLGHRRIGYVSVAGEDNINIIRNNQEFLNTCRELGVSTEYYTTATGFWFDTARKLAAELCRRQNRPSAIVTPGFLFSYGAWQGVMDAGLRIPEDISFIGFDADHCSNPMMSTMMQPFSDAANMALELIFGMQYKGKHLKQHHYEFPVVFLENGSCRQYETKS